MKVSLFAWFLNKNLFHILNMRQAVTLYLLLYNKFIWESLPYTLKAEIFASRDFLEQIFAVNMSETYKFRGINFRNLAIYFKFCGINFHEWCLERSQNEANGRKIYKICRIFAFKLLIQVSEVTYPTHFSY